MKKFKAWFVRYKVLLLGLFILNLIIPDPLIWIDELLMGVAVLYGWI